MGMKYCSFRKTEYNADRIVNVANYAVRDSPMHWRSAFLVEHLGHLGEDGDLVRGGLVRSICVRICSKK